MGNVAHSKLSSDVKVHKVMHAFGFSIPVLTGGKRIWPQSFKRYVREKIDAGKLTVSKVSKECKVSKSLVYQWRRQAKGKPVTASDWR